MIARIAGIAPTLVAVHPFGNVNRLQVTDEGHFQMVEKGLKVELMAVVSALGQIFLGPGQESSSTLTIVAL